MAKWHLPLLALGGALLASAVAHAAGGHGELHVNWWAWDSHAPPVGWFIVDFVLFVWLIYKFAGKGVVAMFKNRHDTIKNAIETSQAAFTKAKAHRDEYAEKLKQVDGDAKTLIEGAKEDGAKERDRIIEASKAYGKQLQTDTTAAVGLEAELARFRLHTELVDGVLAQAESTIEKQVTPEDQARLLEQAIVELEAGKGFERLSGGAS